MKSIGELRENNILKNSAYLGILLSFEWPLLKLYVDRYNPGLYYFHHWVDTDENYDRWLIYSVSNDDLLLFLKGQKSLFNLITGNRYFNLVDLGEEEDLFYELSYGDLPKDYISKDGSFFTDKYFTEYAIQLKHNMNYSLAVKMINEFSQRFEHIPNILDKRALQAIKVKEFNAHKQISDKSSIDYKKNSESDIDFIRTNNLKPFEMGVKNGAYH